MLCNFSSLVIIDLTGFSYNMVTQAAHNTTAEEITNFLVVFGSRDRTTTEI